MWESWWKSIIVVSRDGLYEAVSAGRWRRRNLRMQSICTGGIFITVAPKNANIQMDQMLRMLE